MRQIAHLLPLPTLALATLLSGSAEAQQYGQWTWDGSIGGRQADSRNTIGLDPATTNDESGFDVALGVNGFLLHPALGRFGLSGSAALVDYKGVRTLRSRQLGFGASLSLVPQGRFPLSLYAGRQAYSYSRLTEDDPMLLTGIPDHATSYGGRLRLRSGPLGGTLLGYDHSRTHYQAAGQASALLQTAFADWSGGDRRFTRHARLEQQRQEFELVKYRIDDFTGTFDQTAHLAADRRWQMSASGVRRALTLAGKGSQVLTARTGQRLLDPLNSRAMLDLSYDGGLTHASGFSFQSHTSLLRLQFRANQAWTLTPYAGYTFQQTGSRHAQGPQAGLSAGWSGRAGPVDLAASEGVGVVSLRTKDGPRDSSLALSLGITAGQGDEHGLRKEAEASWAHNRLSRAGETIEALPDLGAGLAGLGTEDDLRGRLTLRRRFGPSLSLYTYGEASRRTFGAPAGANAPGRPTLDTLSATMQATGRRGSLTGNLGSSRVDLPEGQEFRYWAAAFSLRILRRLSIDGSYRGDRRSTRLAPELDTNRFEAGVELGLGAFQLKGLGFQTVERPKVGEERRNRGFVLTLSRQFGGWLPIVTGAPTGGVIQ